MNSHLCHDAIKSIWKIGFWSLFFVLRAVMMPLCLRCHCCCVVVSVAVIQRIIPLISLLWNLTRKSIDRSDWCGGIEFAIDVSDPVSMLGSGNQRSLWRSLQTRDKSAWTTMGPLWLWNPWAESSKVRNWGCQWPHKMDLGPTKTFFLNPEHFVQAKCKIITLYSIFIVT